MSHLFLFFLHWSKESCVTRVFVPPPIPTDCFSRNYFMGLCFFFCLKLAPGMKTTSLPAAGQESAKDDRGTVCAEYPSLCASLAVTYEAAYQAEAWSSWDIREYDLHLGLAKALITMESAHIYLQTRILPSYKAILTRNTVPKGIREYFAVSDTTAFKSYMCPSFL